MPKVTETVRNIDISVLQHKPFLSIAEASALTGIGQHKIEELLKTKPDYLLLNGTKRMIKKDIFLDFLMNQSSI